MFRQRKIEEAKPVYHSLEDLQKSIVRGIGVREAKRDITIFTAIVGSRKREKKDIM